MGEPCTGHARWFWLGVLLPTAVRRRIFEPAYYDLARRHLLTGEGWFAFGVLRLLLGSCCHGLVFLLRDRRRAQRVLLAVSRMALLLSLVMAILLRDWLVRLASHVTA